MMKGIVAVAAAALVLIVVPPLAGSHGTGTLWAAGRGDEDSLAAARDLYSAADYERALQVLDRLRAGDRSADQARAIEQYRAFCLLALGRVADAEQAIAAVVTAEPSFRPSAEVSPRVRSAFSDVRRRMWPSLVQQRYATAKAEFDRKEYTAAAAGFAQVLDMLSDPETGGGSSSQFADVRQLAADFRELSLARIVPPAPAPLPASSSLQVAPVSVGAPIAPASQAAAPAGTGGSPVAQPAANAPAANASTANAPVVNTPAANAHVPSADAAARSSSSAGTVVVPATKRIFSADDPTVVPPTVIRQTLPPYPNQIGAPSPGVLEVVIDETGAVESVAMKVSVNGYYDGTALDAARSWKYRPATLNGQPVKYRKSVQVTVKR